MPRRPRFVRRFQWRRQARSHRHADGKLDVAIVTESTDVDLLYGRGDGTFDPVVRIVLPPNPPTSLSAKGGAVVVGDFNYDGLVATIAPSFSGGAVTFSEAGTTLGTSQVVNGKAISPLRVKGVASIGITPAGTGSHCIVAIFNGFGDHPAARRGAVIQVANSVPAMSELALLALAIVIGAFAVTRQR